MLDDMRANDKQQWYALVRQRRTMSSLDELGVADLRLHKKAVLESTQSMIQAVGVRDTSDIFVSGP